MPPVGGPATDENRQARVPKSIEGYLKKRYGEEVRVDIACGFGKPDGSDYSYGVNLEGNQIAEMTAIRTTISLLPPDYEGFLKKATEEIRQRNSLLTRNSRREELVRTLWQIDESPQATQMRVEQFKNKTK